MRIWHCTSIRSRTSPSCTPPWSRADSCPTPNRGRGAVVERSVSTARSYRIRVAGPSALLVAKIVKLHERLADEASGVRSRVRAKDALDIYRLLRAIEVPAFVAGFGLHVTEPNAAVVSAEATALVRAL